MTTDNVQLEQNTYMHDEYSILKKHMSSKLSLSDMTALHNTMVEGRKELHAIFDNIGLEYEK